jgi:hypothetical protein
MVSERVTRMQWSHKTNTRLISLVCACLCTLPTTLVGRRADAQDATAPFARALRILDEIDRLLAAIQARLEAGGVTKSTVTAEGRWESLFDGQSLKGWKRTDFGGGGEVRVEKSFRGGPPAIVVGMGDALSGFNWTGDVPKTNYEIALEAMRIDGGDFMCGLTFPVGDSHASLILGGWGGAVVGISSIDNQDASENETTKYMTFPKDRWYKIRMRVTPAKLEAWLDEKKIVDQDITKRKITLRHGEISKSIPLGISTYQTTAAYRDIKLRRLDPTK